MGFIIYNKNNIKDFDYIYSSNISTLLFQEKYDFYIIRYKCFVSSVGRALEITISAQMAVKSLFSDIGYHKVERSKLS
jgi:hypothetical protein